MGSLGTNFHDGPGVVTGSGRRVRIRVKRWRSVREFPTGLYLDGKDRCFFQVMSCWCGQNLNSSVNPEVIQVLLTGSRKNVPQVMDLING
jgi:hypothetical protein